MTDHPGASALDGYRRARTARRRAALRCAGVVLMGAVVSWMVWRSAGAEATAAVGVVVAVAAFVVRARADPQRWLRGARGEVATAAVLSGLRRDRWVVLHDRRIPGSFANIDHLAIGPTGVWVLDSKTRRAARLRRRSIDVGPLLWETQVVSDRLDVPARPMVVVHGARLRRRGVRRRGVRVVPPDGLVRRLRRGRRRLGRDDVVALAGVAERVFRPAGWNEGEREEPRGRRLRR